jgi:hypothetical protein
MPREEAAAALRNRAQQLRVHIDRFTAGMATEWIRRKPAHVAWMWELGIARSEAEIAWCERVAKLIEGGASYVPEIVAPGDGEGWARWRASAPGVVE